MTRPTALGSLLQWGLLAVIAIFPLWFLPVTSDAFAYQKQHLLLAIGAGILVAWLVKTVRTRRVSFTLSPFVVAMILVLAANLLSALTTVNPLYQLTGRILSVIGMALIVVFGSNVVRQLRWRQLLSAFSIGGALLALTSVLQFTPFKLTMIINTIFRTQYAHNSVFSLAESPLAAFMFLLPVAMAGIVTIFEKNAESRRGKWFGALLVPTILSLAGSLILGFALLRIPDFKPILLPYQQSWIVAIETMKQPIGLLRGVGTENFQSAYLQFHDVSMNNHTLWAARFGVSGAEWLNILTTTGLLGTFAWIGLLITMVLMSLKLGKGYRSLLLFVAIQALLFFALPFSVLSFAMIAFTLLALTNELREQQSRLVREAGVVLATILFLPQDGQGSSQYHGGFVFAVAILAGLGILAGSYGVARAYASNVVFYQALQASQRNDAKATYELQQKAINLFPYQPLFHRAYASTNLAIAQALAQQGADKLSDQDKQTIASLLQQAIREARVVTTLNPINSDSWEMLGNIYANLLDVQGADQWASAALAEAIRTNQTSPQLRLELANLYLTLGQSQSALSTYEQAIQLKPDWPNAFFAYGVALERAGEFMVAQQAYQRTLDLLPADSTDRTAVQKQIDAVKPKAEAQLKQQQEAADKQAAAATAAQKGAKTTPTATAAPTPTPATIPSPSSPAVPSAQPQASNPPGFNEAPKPTSSPNIKLPTDVGF